MLSTRLPLQPLDQSTIWGRDNNYALPQDNCLSAQISVLLRLICRGWKAAIDNARPWRLLSSSSLGARSPRTLDWKRLRSSPAIVHAEAVTLSDQSAVMNDSMRRALGNAASLSVIELKDCHIDPASFVDGMVRGRVSSKLTTLILSNCQAGDPLILALAAVPLPRLSALALTECGKTLQPTGTNGDGTVNISRDQPLEARGGDPLTDASLAALLGVTTAAPSPGTGIWSTLQVLRLSQCHFVTDAVIASALAHCPLLHDVDVSKCPLLDGSFLSALRDCEVAGRLTRLVLAGVGSAASTHQACRANAMAAFAAIDGAPPAFPLLTVIDISWCPWVDDDTLPVLLAALGSSPALKHFAVHACTRVTWRGLAGLAKLPCVPWLTHLDIGQLPELEDGEVAALLSGSSAAFASPRQRLVVGAGGREEVVVDTPMHQQQLASSHRAGGAPILQAARSLVYLDLSGCCRIGTATYTSIGRHCPALTHLRSRVTVKVGSAAFRCWFNAAREARQDARRGELLQMGQQVSHGSSSSSALDNDAAHDASSVISGGDSSVLWTTTMSSFTGGGNDTPGRPPGASSSSSWMARLAASPPPFSLPITHLDLWRCLEVDDDALRLIASHCPALTHLDLDGADVAVTDAGVAAIAKGCPGLLHLSLANVPASDTSLRALARHCPRLAFLDLANGLEYTSKGLVSMIKSLGGLQVLKLQRCSGVTDAVLHAIVTSCPYLRSLTLRSCGQGDEHEDRPGLNVMGGELLPLGVGAASASSASTSESSSGASYAAQHAALVSGGHAALTAACLDILAPATLPPNGRLASLGVSYLPCLTVKDLYRFLVTTAMRRDCSLVTFKGLEGAATQDLEALAVALRRQVLAAAAAAAALAATAANSNDVRFQHPITSSYTHIGEGSTDLVSAGAAPTTAANHEYDADAAAAGATTVPVNGSSAAGAATRQPGGNINHDDVANAAQAPAQAAPTAPAPAPSLRVRRYRALQRLEYVIPGLKIEWRVTGAAQP